MSRKIVKVKKIFLRNHQNEFIREFFRFGLKLNPIILIMSHRRRLVIFPDYFNFKVEVTSDGWAYWADSMRVPPIVPGVNEELSILLTFRLEQNYPNPFNPTTKIKYSIPDMSKVSLAMNNLLGEEVIILVNEE